MESRHAVSAANKYGKYGARNSYLKGKELAVNNDEDSEHDSFSDDGSFPCVTVSVRSILRQIASVFQ